MIILRPHTTLYRFMNQIGNYAHGYMLTHPRQNRANVIADVLDNQDNTNAEYLTNYLQVPYGFPHTDLNAVYVRILRYHAMAYTSEFTTGLLNILVAHIADPRILRDIRNGAADFNNENRCQMIGAIVMAYN